MSVSNLMKKVHQNDTSVLLKIKEIKVHINSQSYRPMLLLIKARTAASRSAVAIRKGNKQKQNQTAGH